MSILTEIGEWVKPLSETEASEMAELHITVRGRRGELIAATSSLLGDMRKLPSRNHSVGKIGLNAARPSIEYSYKWLTAHDLNADSASDTCNGEISELPLSGG